MKSPTPLGWRVVRPQTPFAFARAGSGVAHSGAERENKTRMQRSNNFRERARTSMMGRSEYVASIGASSVYV